MRFADALEQAPLAAILRGITPHEVVATSDALYRAGIRIVEVPMNSPDALESVRLLAHNFSGRLVGGAGTVIEPDWVDSIAAAGGEIIIAPNTDTEVIRRASAKGLVAMPGFATPSEAFAAYRAGARYLKLYPARTYGPDHLRQLFSVLPADVVVLPVGGIEGGNIASWWAAGARGFGIGSEIFRPGQPTHTTYTKAITLLGALKDARNGS
jgi:2-dehydro-3-deoxyphosphogalactonate aldolase